MTGTQSESEAERQARQWYSSVAGLSSYADLLATAGVVRGLIGPREVPRLWSRHLANCAVVAEDRSLVPTGARVIDVGSGAGLPGIVWSLVRPDLQVELLEPLLRRAQFLTEVVSDLDLGRRVEVTRGRAEDSQVSPADVVTARAVANLPTLIGWTMPLVREGGHLVALKGSAVAEEVAAAGTSLARWRAGQPRIVVLESHGAWEGTTVVVVDREPGEIVVGTPRRSRKRRPG